MEEQSFQEFYTEFCKRRSPKNIKITNSWGVYDAYKLIRKNKWYDIGKPLKEHEFYTVVRKVNNYLADNIAKGKTVYFPWNMGKLELKKDEVGVSLVNNKPKITYPINWLRTALLWYEDKEARESKVLLRDEPKYVFRVRYGKEGAAFENKVFYRFTLNRFIKRALKDNIKQDKIETLW